MPLHAPTTSSTATEPVSTPPLSPTTPLLVWLALQLLILLLPVLEVPLSDNFPRPAERMALHEMLTAQIVFSSVFFPFLFRRSMSGALTAFSAWPFIQITGSLSATSSKIVLISGVFVTLWLAALATWGYVLRSRPERQMACTIASALAVLGPVFWYANAEYGVDSNHTFEGILAVISPSVAALTQLRSREVLLAPFVFVAVLILLSTAPLLWRHVTHRSSTVP